MDTRRNVLFVSKYFLEFMGLKEDEVIGRKCYEAGCASSSPCKPCNPCAIEESLISGKAEYMRQEQKTRNGWKIFDLFGVPLLNSDGKADYVIEIIIDRTDEVNLERLRTNDFVYCSFSYSYRYEHRSSSCNWKYIAVYELRWKSFTDGVYWTGAFDGNASFV